MGMYDDILKQMQGSFMQNNPKMFGKPAGFSDPRFNFNNQNFSMNRGDPDVKPGGGGSGETGGGGQGDGSPGGGGSGNGDNNQNTNNNLLGSTNYGGSFTSTFSTMSDTLSGAGLEGFLFRDPGSHWGFGAGSGYEDYFQTFDTAAYQASMEALKELEARRFTNIGQQYEYGTEGLQAGLEEALLDLEGKESISGLYSGRGAERRRMAREIGGLKMDELGRKTQAQYSDVQREIGQHIGTLEGTLVDYLTRQSNIALSLEQADADKMEAGGEASSTWANQPRGNSMTAEQLSGYNIFGDLTNGQAAWSEFVATAHTNLNESQLNELAQSIYDSYQRQEEETV
tara:strand:+ start:4163 stop:5188 length:1026 start_codon:yes stop_codon:yes gene_type:complete